jgi:O-antigen ligase
MRKNNNLLLHFFILGVFISSLIFTRYTLDYTLVPRFMLLSAFLFVLVLLFLVTGKKLTFDIDLISLSYFSFVVFTCLTLFWAKNTAEALFDSCRQILFFLVFIFTAVFYSPNKNLFFGSLLYTALVLIIISIIMVAYQFYTYDFSNRYSIYSITGISSHKNLFSGFLFLMLFFSTTAIVYPKIQLALTPKFLKTLFTQKRIILLATSVLIVILLLRSRAVWLGIIVSICLFFVLEFSKPFIASLIKKISAYWLILSTVVLINSAFLFAFQPLINKSLERLPPPLSDKNILNTETAIERLVIWDKTFCAIDNHLSLGVGAGNWQIYFPACGLAGLDRVDKLYYTCQRPHNDFLWILSETGLIGFNLYIIFLCSLFFFLLKAATNTESNQEFRFINLIISFLAGYFIYSFFDYPRERIELGIWINIALGISYAAVKEKNCLPTIKNQSLNQKFLIPLLVVTVFAVFVGFQRFKGENCTIKMYLYKAEQKPEKIISAGMQAESFAYNLDPTSIPVDWYIGHAYASLGNNNKAFLYFTSAYRQNPYNRNVLCDLGSACFLNNDFQTAKKFYFEAARISPAFDDPKLNLVALFLNENNFTQAEFWLKSVKHESDRTRSFRQAIKALKSKN